MGGDGTGKSKGGEASLVERTIRTVPDKYIFKRGGRENAGLDSTPQPSSSGTHIHTNTHQRH